MAFILSNIGINLDLIIELFNRNIKLQYHDMMQGSGGDNQSAFGQDISR